MSNIVLPDDLQSMSISGQPTNLYINAISAYTPAMLLDNAYFAGVTGRSEAWFKERTGIDTRSRAGSMENADTMAVASVEMLPPNCRDLVKKVDLIIGASYTPFDTVGTIAHRVQKHFSIRNAKSIYLSSACSSFFNSLEITQAFLSTRKSTLALIVVSEHNSGFSDDRDCQSGHLWGDGAAAIILGPTSGSNCLFEVLDVETRGLGHLGDGPDGVFMRPMSGGLIMENGRDVFNFACREMTNAVVAILKRNGLSVHEIAKFVPHQANARIIENVAERLGFPLEDVLTTVGRLGNTGSASIPITLARCAADIRSGDLIALAAFGGGYSSGAALLRCIQPIAASTSGEGQQPRAKS
jgi:3-oxoacyl-[acyl-carrier-protein] synthase-3